MKERRDTDTYFKLGEIHGDIKRLDLKSDTMIEEARRTNGRVTSLEKDIVSIRLKVAYYTGGFAVVIWVIEKVVSNYL